MLPSLISDRGRSRVLDLFPEFDIGMDLGQYSRSRYWQESDNDYVLSLDMPGVPRESVEITLEKNMLSVLAKHENRRFECSVNVPAGADTESCEATLTDGVLSVKMAKEPRAKPRKIEVRG